MMDEKRRALYEGWQAAQSNCFWQQFWAELLRKRAYLLRRLAEAATWEDTCRIQGELACCRRLILFAESAGKEEKA